MSYTKNFLGEVIGTYLMVLFGCGAVAVSTLFGEYTGIFQIGIMWGIAVIIAIYATRNLCCAHFNPAVTIAMAVTGRMTWKKVPVYIAAQFAGAFLAGSTLYGVFGSTIAAYEVEHQIVRGSENSVVLARMFGEFYQTSGSSMPVTMGIAMLAEGLGTFILVFMIFALTEGCNTGRPSNGIAPVFIGMTLSSAICLFAPLTQAGFNPARDFAPRIVAYLAGWGSAAFPDTQGGFFFVYMLAPIIGGVVAGVFFTHVVQPQMEKKETTCGCGKEKVNPETEIAMTQVVDGK